MLWDLAKKIYSQEKLPKEWRESCIVPIYKEKGDIQGCANYGGIRLMSHTIKIWERIMDQTISKETSIVEEQFGFIPGRGTTDAVFDLRQMMEKHQEKQKGLHIVFIYLAMAYDRVPHPEVWRYMRIKGTTEKYVRLVQGIRDQSHWCMLSADDIVLCSNNGGVVESKLEQCRKVLEDRGLKISRKKTEYLSFNEDQDSKIESQEAQGAEDPEGLGDTVKLEEGKEEENEEGG
ncbi:uncharacterized protein [Macrobrachium rosenbergii]|uniref:uncharacterized protein n=1 Tax=Macrobrachium rosenbergii TaxID=79674 RepID=UPI0034D5D300